MGNCSGYPSARTQLPQDTTPSTTTSVTRSDDPAHNGVRILPTTSKPSETPPPLGRVLGRPIEDVRSTYTFGRELGRGQFGVTYLVTHKLTHEQFACKSIATRKLVNRDDIEDVRREVQIMHHLTGHRNIVELKGAFEDRHSVNLVMELCAGGELFDRIIAKGHYSERAAAVLCRQIVTVVHNCHSMGVMHRDLKPENFLLLSKDEDSPLKATDFGLSMFFKPGDVFKDLVGSAYYVAPEVLRRNYGAEADIWSAGVILYILLSGVPPFWGENEQRIFDAILRGHIDFTSDPWPSISSSAKDLVKRMLRADPKERLSAVQVLGHAWMREDRNPEDSEEAPEDSGSEEDPQLQTPSNGVAEYERQRLSRIAENRSRMEALGLPKIASALWGSAQKVSEKMKKKKKRKGKEKVDDEDDDEDYRLDMVEEGLSSSSGEEENDDDDDEGYLGEKSSGSRRKKNKGSKPKKKVPAQKCLSESDYIDDDDALKQALALSLQGSAGVSGVGHCGPSKCSEADVGNASRNKNKGNTHDQEDKGGRKRKKSFASRLQMTEDELVVHFFQFDAEWKGSITMRDIERVAMAHDFLWAEKELADMIRCFDSDGDGKLSLDDFRKIACRCNMIKGPENS